MDANKQANERENGIHSQTHQTSNASSWQKGDKPNENAWAQLFRRQHNMTPRLQYCSTIVMSWWAMLANIHNTAKQPFLCASACVSLLFLLFLLSFNSIRIIHQPNVPDHYLRKMYFHTRTQAYAFGTLAFLLFSGLGEKSFFGWCNSGFSPLVIGPLLLLMCVIKAINLRGIISFLAKVYRVRFIVQREYISGRRIFAPQEEISWSLQ